jgi:nitric oxide dioxygenase
MDPCQADLVRDSFVQVLFAPERATRLFYGRLFALAPDTRPLFRTDMTEQGRRLIETLAKIVTSLTRLDAMLPGLRQLAARHVDYGVEDRHYAAAGEALLYMVARLAGAKFDRATEAAWREAYALVAGVMIDAGRDARRASANPEDAPLPDQRDDSDQKRVVSR